MTTQDEQGALLHRSRFRDHEAAARLMPVIYHELRRIARLCLQNAGADPTLQPTALVHEAYCKLINQHEVGPDDRTHFFALAAAAIRQVVVDEARARATAKRGGGWRRVPFSFVGELTDGHPIDVVDLSEALERLAELDSRAARVVELRFFGGLSQAEVAAELNISERTVRNDWTAARAWLRCQLEGKDS